MAAVSVDEDRTRLTRSMPLHGSADTGPHAGEAAADLARSLSPGRMLGRFMILGALGEGGMAVVLRAYDPELDRQLAIKVMRGDVYGERASIGQSRIHREAHALARLSHPNIVQVYEAGSVPGGVFIAMELVRGVTLRAWSKEKPRTWREVVEVFKQAAAGVAAAHAAGIVHRDFKPDNVLVGDDGRVRVVDFGLARPGGEAARTDGSPPRLDPDLLVTQAGAVIGTPAYMAPEQHLGQPADARSDVFGLCVSLHEALYGSRPFTGATAADVRRSVLLGEPTPPPHDRAVPGWLRTLVARGLRRDPAERPASMQEVVTELGRDHAAGLRRWGLSAAFVGLLAGWIGTSVLAGSGPRCEDIAGRFAGVWDPPRRAEIQRALLASGVGNAAATWDRVAPALDEYTAAWLREATARCAAADADRIRNQLAALCLERRHAELAALVDVLARGDATVVEHAVEATRQLVPPVRCGDPAHQTDVDAAPPGDPVAVAALRQRLVVLAAEERAGHFAAVLADSAALAAEARALAYPPLLAEALVRRGSLLARAGAYADADAALVEAYAAAEAADHEPLRAEALVLRIEVVGFQRAQPDEVAAWTPAAVALVERIAPESALAARLDAAIGLTEFAAKRYAAAERHQRAALALLGRVAASDDPQRIAALLHLGRTLWHTPDGQQEALMVLEEARALAESALGPEHPSLVAIYLNLANAYTATDPVLLIHYYEKSLALGERVLGPDHPTVASALANLGNSWMHQGRLAAALANYRRAVDIYLKTLGEAHPTTAMNICNLATALVATRQFAEAHAWYDRARAIYERVHGGVHPDQAMAIGGHGEAYAAEERWEEARAAARHAFEVATSQADAKPPWHAPHWQLHEATALTRLGRFAEARTLAEAVLASGAPLDVETTARLRLTLARALVGTGARADGVAMAERARADLRALPRQLWESPLPEVEAWLAAQPR